MVRCAQRGNQARQATNSTFVPNFVLCLCVCGSRHVGWLAVGTARGPVTRRFPPSLRLPKIGRRATGRLKIDRQMGTCPNRVATPSLTLLKASDVEHFF